MVWSLAGSGGDGDAGVGAVHPGGAVQDCALALPDHRQRHDDPFRDMQDRQLAGAFGLDHRLRRGKARIACKIRLRQQHDVGAGDLVLKYFGKRGFMVISNLPLSQGRLVGKGPTGR